MGTSLGSDAQSPAEILNALPRTVTTRSILLEGELANSTGADIWNVIVNDSPVYRVKAAKKGSVSLRLAIALHDGNNTVGIDGVRNPTDDTPLSIRHWSTHIYVDSDTASHQFAILIEPQSGTGTNRNITALRFQLNQAGITPNNLLVAQNRPDFDEALKKVRERKGSNDKLLIYFRGRGSVSTAQGEPVLLVSSQPSNSADWISLSELSREAKALAPVSYVLDVNFQSGGTDSFVRNSGDLVQQAKSDQRAFGWLQSMPPGTLSEVVLSNPFGTEPPGTVTHLLLSHLSAQSDSGCTTLADVGQSIAALSNNTQEAPEAVYLATDNAYSSFCISSSNIVTDGVTLNVSPYPFPDSFMLVGRIEAVVPMGLTGSWREVLVDGVVVRRVFANQPDDNKIVDMVSLSEGPHVIEERFTAGAKVVAYGRTTFDMAPAVTMVQADTETLTADILRPVAPRSITSSSFYRIGFIVADSQTDSVHYELRNNGVVILRGVAGGRQAGQVLEIFRKIPLSVGENNIVIEVRRGNETRSAHCVVVRRLEQPLRAVIIGGDQGGGLMRLNGVRADVESVKRVLLKYTDLNPRNLVILDGSNATQAAVRAAVSKATTNHLETPTARADIDETFVLYFSGYGTTLLNADGKTKTRCIVTADFDPNANPQTCISTTEIDRMLDAWKNSIVIFDTSYDGLSGVSSKVATKGFLSRTFGDYLSSDTDWRTSAGTDRPNRVFLVGSSTNAAALESTDPPQGLFTRALVEAIEENIGDVGLEQARLFDVFTSARFKTIERSGKAQTPLIKGTLTAPFYFRLRPTEDLATEARVIDLGIRDDIQSLRSIDPSDIDRAQSLYEAILAVHPNDVEAQQGMVRLLIYRGQFESAEASVNSTLLASDSLPPSKLSGWYLLGAGLKMRRGDISGALSDCERAERANPNSALVASQLPKLYFALGDYKKSAALTSQLVSRAAALTRDLTDDEWAHIILLGYIAMRRSTGTEESNAWLKRHFGAYSPSRSLPAAIVHVLAMVPGSVLGRGQSLDVIKVRSPWFQLAAEFFLEPEADGSTLQSFNDKNSAFDAKNPQALEFMSHFYRAMKLLLSNAPEMANTELKLAIETNQKQFAEFWIAQSESNRIQ